MGKWTDIQLIHRNFSMVRYNKIKNVYNKMFDKNLPTIKLDQGLDNYELDDMSIDLLIKISEYNEKAT